MVEQEKKAPVNPPQTTALTPPAQAPEPLPAKKPGGWFTRENKLAIVVLGSFIALAAGVYVVKVGFKTKHATDPTEVVQAPPADSNPQLPPQMTRQTGLEPSPMPQIDTSTPKAAPALEPPPVIVPMGSLNDPSLMLPKEPKKDEPLAIDPLIFDVPNPPKDVFSSVKKKDAVKSELPSLDRPPVIEAPPEAKGTVIRVGASEPKKDPPLKIDVPVIPDPPPAIDPPKKKDPPAIDPALVIDPPAKKDAPKIEAPAIDPPLIVDAPKKKDPPKKDPPKNDLPAIDLPLVIDPPAKKDVQKKDPPVIDPPSVIDPPAKKDVPVIEIDLKKDPTLVAPKKIDAPANSNDYDEDLHPFKKDDTYRSISKQYYNSDAYSIALQRYNRDHPGQADYVRVPPIWVLEKKYASDIASTSAHSTSNAAPLSVELARNERLYTVGDNGEMLADIARKTLGSEDAWKRIWDMNPQLNPAKMIPGGTRLRLP